MGANLSGVRIHHDQAAAESAAEQGAQAYTLGNSIFFGAGRYDPESTQGRSLLLHELTHVVQQSRSGPAGTDSGVGEAEHEAEAVANVAAMSVALKPGPTAAGPERVQVRSGPTKAAKTTSAPVNDPSTLASAISVKQLFALYASNEPTFVIGPLPPFKNPSFTRGWVRGKGRVAVEQEIARRLTGLSQHELIGYLNYADANLRPPEYDTAILQSLFGQIGSQLPLTHDQRVELRQLVGVRLSMAYTDFTNAAAANAASLKAAVNAEAALLALLVDVFMGLAAPGLAAGIAAAANRIPVMASNLTYRIALASLDMPQIGLVLAAATKVGKEAIKLQAQPLFGESDVDAFIRGLKHSFRVGVDAVAADLPNRSDDELGVLAATYEPEQSDEAHYIPLIKDLIDRFRKQVQPIGPATETNLTDPIDRTLTEQVGLIWLSRGPDVILAQVALTRSSLDPGSRMYFRTFVEQDLADIAIRKALSSQPRGIQHIGAESIIGVPSLIPATAARR